MTLKTLALSAMLAVTLAACAELAWNKTATAPPPPKGDGPVVAARPAPPSKPAKSSDLNTIRPAPRPSADREVAVEAALSPPRLVGLSEDETAQLLGRPAEEEAEPPGKIWIYRTTGCRLAVHLFPDMDKGGFYTLDYTVADGGREACLGKIAGEAKRKG